MHVFLKIDKTKSRAEHSAIVAFFFRVKSSLVEMKSLLAINWVARVAAVVLFSFVCVSVAHAAPRKSSSRRASGKRKAPAAVSPKSVKNESIEKVAVLGIEAGNGVRPGVAAAITEAFKREIGRSNNLKLVPGRDLIEVKLVFSCADEAPSCMAQAGQSLGASKLLFGSLKATQGGSYLVALKYLDVKASVDLWVADRLSRQVIRKRAFATPVSRWFTRLTGNARLGKVRIQGGAFGATVFVDGIREGSLTDAELTLPDVPAGQHTIAVMKAGFEPFEQAVQVVAGQTVDIKVPSPTDLTAFDETALDGEADDAGASGSVTEGSAGASGGGRRTAAWITAVEPSRPVRPRVISSCAPCNWMRTLMMRPSTKSPISRTKASRRTSWLMCLVAPPPCWQGRLCTFSCPARMPRTSRRPRIRLFPWRPSWLPGFKGSLRGCGSKCAARYKPLRESEFCPNGDTLFWT